MGISRDASLAWISLADIDWKVSRTTPVSSRMDSAGESAIGIPRDSIAP